MLTKSYQALIGTQTARTLFLLKTLSSFLMDQEKLKGMCMILTAADCKHLKVC
jgi:hypothetical protein